MRLSPRRAFTTLTLGALTLFACDGRRTLSLVSVLPRPCGSGIVSSLRVNGLGDFPPSPSQSAALGEGGVVDLDLPRGTRVISIEGLGPSGRAALGRTAPSELGLLWDAPGGARSAPLAYGPPDTFCETDELAYARADHRATLLVDGSVLLSGGVDSSGLPVVALERYLPAGDAMSAVARFSPVGVGEGTATIDARAVLGHDATRLSDGRVLLSGGAPAQDGRADGIAYEGARLLGADGRSDDAPRVLGGGPRAFHAGLLLRDGRVLLTGGCSELSAGDCAAGRTLASVSIYDPGRDVFLAGPSLLQPRQGHRALYRDDGLIVLVGGVGEGGVVLAPELYDPSESRGSTLVGPAGRAVSLDSGLVVAVDDAGGPSARASGWSGRDEASVRLSPLPGARTAATLTALEDGAVLVAGGWDEHLLAGQSAILVVGGGATPLGGFSARGHTATRLLDGTVLLAGGFDASGRANAHAAVFIHSLIGPLYTPPTLGFDEALGLTPSRPDRIAIVDGALWVDAGAPARVPEVFARLSGPDLAGPTGAGFDAQVLVGRPDTTGTSDTEAALLFGDPGGSDYVAVLVAVGRPARLLVVSPDRPGLPHVEERTGCTAEVVADAELPVAGLAGLHLTMRDGRLELRSDARLILSCGGADAWAPSRGGLAVGARAGRVRYDNLLITR